MDLRRVIYFWDYHLLPCVLDQPKFTIISDMLWPCKTGPSRTRAGFRATCVTMYKTFPSDY